MHELACPACSAPSQYDFRDYLLMCPFCSTTFHLDTETGQKTPYGDHFIVPNTIDGRAVKELVQEWLRRLHHKPGQVDKEFFVTDIRGFSVPFWVVSLEAHTVWKGLVQKQRRNPLDHTPGADFLHEKGQFRRSYRWAVSARSNLCEMWGMTRLHEPNEQVTMEWDGFPLDSTFSRGRLSTDAREKSAYDVREFFEFKFANSLPILGIQVDEDEALRRAQSHVRLYHYKLSRMIVDHLVDYRTELDIAGIQLIHLPFWHALYVYKPRTALRHFYRPREKNLLLDGYGKGVLKGELAIVHSDKVWVNAVVCSLLALVFFLLGALWHPAFFLVALFAASVAGASAYIAVTRAQRREAADAQKSNETQPLKNATSAA